MTKPKRPQNRTLQPGVHMEALGVTPLAEGQRTVLARARASVESADWWEQLTSAQRGEVIEQGYDERLSELRRAAQMRELK